MFTFQEYFSSWFLLAETILKPMSMLHMGMSEENNFKICTCAKKLLHTCSIGEKADSHLIYLTDPDLHHEASVYVGIISANCCRFPGIAFSARSDSLEIP